jgi:hypothetical protein
LYLIRYEGGTTMSYAFIRDVPIDEEQYETVSRHIGGERVAPAVRAMRATRGIEQPAGPVPEQRIEVLDVMVGARS